MSKSAGMKLWDYAFSGAVIIDRSAKQIWPYFFGDKKGWSNAEYTTVAGTPGQVGEVYVMNRPSHASHGARMFYEAIRIEPEKEIILKIDYQDGASDEKKLMGYDLVMLEEMQGRTRVLLQQVFTKWVDADVDLTQETARQNGFLPQILQNLKRWVEQEK